MAGNVTEPNEIKVNDDGWIEFTYQINVNGEEEIYYGRGRDLVTPVENYRLLVGRVVNNEIKLKERFFYSSLWSIILIIFLGISGGYILSRNFLKRISNINITSKKIMDGNLSERLPTTKGKDELNQLSSNLNEMLDRLDSLMTNMKQVTDNIAHDLRTQLNRIRTNLEVTLMSNSDVDQYKKSIDDAIIETDNLIKTFNSILSISKVESGASDLDKSVININDLIMNLFDLYEPITDAKGIILNHDVDEEIKIEGILGLPPLHKGSSKLIQTFVNNRSVENRMLTYAIRETYTDFLPHKRFPVAIINISISPDQVDVNVHPTKSVVKFLDEGKIFSTIQKTIRTTLTEQMPIPDLSGKSLNIDSPKKQNLSDINQICLLYTSDAADE